ncbi:MAG: hypothetical protein A6D92_24065 [Symbiobacterium thermophilum]|uniref:Solute-binding protein family 5 domain-containing protein n=1 Tax=Symbiobacterium thermophilum TaxID=2734 RepID=A0A1Y2T3A3_SYMTR|nr:MAG: hypothetical protein A6D92_24065 [Symbiobacterium thermophilum]
MLAVLMLAAVGCSGRSSSGSQEMVIRMNIGTNPPSLDPRVTTGLPESHVEIALFEGLMRLDERATRSRVRQSGTRSTRTPRSSPSTCVTA